jgi:hypothetical protein
MLAKCVTKRLIQSRLTPRDSGLGTEVTCGASRGGEVARSEGRPAAERSRVIGFFQDRRLYVVNYALVRRCSPWGFVTAERLCSSPIWGANSKFALQVWTGWGLWPREDIAIQACEVACWI